MQHLSAPQLIEAIGEDYFTNDLGFTQRNLRHIRATGKFASQWYGEISKKCFEHGVPCPLSAFNMKVIDKEIGNGSDAFQVLDTEKDKEAQG